MMLHNSCLICTSSSLPVLVVKGVHSVLLLSGLYHQQGCVYLALIQVGVLLHTQHNSYLGTMLSHLYTSHVRLCLKFNTSMLFLFSLVAYLPSISCQGISTFHSEERYFSMLSKSSSKSTTVPTPPGIVKGTLEKLKLSIQYILYLYIL